MTRNEFGVRVGQVWRDNNPRAGRKRLLRVAEVDEAQAPCGRARCELITPREKGEKSYVHIRLDRFNGSVRGYSLVTDLKEHHERRRGSRQRNRGSR
jgi:hypothetical protein